MEPNAPQSPATRRPNIADDARQSLSIPRAFALAAAQLTDRRVLGLLAKSAVISLVLLALVLWAGFSAFMAGFDWLSGGVSLSEGNGGLMRAAGQLAAVIFAVISGWLVWRIVAMAVLQFFADDVVAAVEARHYPGFTPRDVPMTEEIAMALRGLLRTLAVNAVVIPLALVLIVTGVGTAVLFIGVNAMLLGRELQEMVWARHPRDAGPHQGAFIAPLAAGTRFLLGLAVVGLLAVPVLGFLAPFLGAAAATHLVHRAVRQTAE